LNQKEKRNGNHKNHKKTYTKPKENNKKQ
jgi:hypothetical protein